MARRSIHIGAWQESLLGGASLVAVGNRIFTAGLMARDSVSLESEAHQVFSTIAGLLHASGSNLADVVRTRLFYVAEGADEALRAVHGVVFNSPGPATSAVRVALLPHEAEVALEVEAVRGAAGSMTHHKPDDAAGASAAVRVGGDVFVGGVTAPSAGDHAAQMAAVFGTATDTLAALGVSPADVTATRHYYSYEQRDERAPSEETPQSVFMAAGEPTSAGICVTAAGPAGTTFAFECKAVEGASASRNNVRTGRTFEVDHHYSRAVRVDDVVYVAGSTSIVPGETVRHPSEVRGQVLDTLETIRWAIEEQGFDWGNTVRTRSYIVGGLDKLAEAAAAIAEVTGELDAVHTLTGVPVLGRPEVRRGDRSDGRARLLTAAPHECAGDPHGNP